MKNYVIFCLLFLSQMSFGLSPKVELPKNAYAISSIENASLASVDQIYPICRPRRECLNYVEIKVKIELKGCVDSLGNVQSYVQFNNDTQKYDVFLSATNIHSKFENSNTACSLAIPVVYKKIQFRSAYSENLADYNLILLK